METATSDRWKRQAMEGQLRLAACFPGANLAVLHAVTRARLAALRGGMLGPDPVLGALAAAVERRDAAAQEWAGREALLAAGQAELEQIQAEFCAADAAGVLDTLGWQAGRPAPLRLGGSALARWQAVASARLPRLVHAVLALEEARPALLAEHEAARAARIAALARKLTGHAGLSWHKMPGPADDTLPPPLRAATLEARGAAGQRLTLHWRQDAASGMEWLRWQSQAGQARDSGSVAGRAAVLAVLQPLALAA